MFAPKTADLEARDELRNRSFVGKATDLKQEMSSELTFLRRKRIMQNLSQCARLEMNEFSTRIFNRFLQVRIRFATFSRFTRLAQHQQK